MDKVNLRIEKIYGFILAAVSITAGVIGGFWLGIIIGMILAGFILDTVLGVDVSGEASFAVSGYGFLLGAPIGIISGAILGYKKRHSKKWAIVFILVLLIAILKYFSTAFISPLGGVMKLFN